MKKSYSPHPVTAVAERLRPRSSSMAMVLAAGLSLALAVLTASAQQTDLPYESGSTGADGALSYPDTPTGRSQAEMVYDSARQRVVLFGGYRNGYFQNDTWEWDGTTWTLKNPANAPSARCEHAMAYDSARQRVILFGGNQNGSFQNDTWEWDGTNWSQKTPVDAPTTRYAPAMAYDSARQRVVLFGGNTYTSGRSNDTWEWDGTNWTQKSPTSTPSARDRHGMAYDSARQRVVLFGGYGGGYQNDTWEWNGTDWAQTGSGNNGPGGRDYFKMAFDSARQRVVLFGGIATGSSYLSDTWEWNGTIWILREPTTFPPGRHAVAAAYDTVRQKVVIFGGYIRDGSSYAQAGDTWEWDGTNWAMKASTTQVFDMTTRANGVWNFTSIHIPGNVAVSYKKNSTNTPVVWLASGTVRIDGVLDLRGGNATGTNVPDGVGKGGPGGFDGGLGGTRFNVSASYVGYPGQGPGGGLGGNNSYGNNATHDGTYGNAYVQPLIGGSGGGGGGSIDPYDGSSGGGGGGAILIGASRDIELNGQIWATGGVGGASSYYYWSGGNGSGGAVRLVADRVIGAGKIDVGTSGRIRLEGFYRALAGNSHSRAASGAPPTTTFATAAAGQLAVKVIAGKAVPQPASGSLTEPDVVFTEAGDITVQVTGTNIPDGTPVSLRITHSGGVIAVPSKNLTEGSVIFTTKVPGGLGTIQASAVITSQ